MTKTATQTTSAEHRAAAERWLDKAIAAEAGGQTSKSMIDKMLDKACEYELLANGKAKKAA